MEGVKGHEDRWKRGGQMGHLNLEGLDDEG